MKFFTTSRATTIVPLYFDQLASQHQEQKPSKALKFCSVQVKWWELFLEKGRIILRIDSEVLDGPSCELILDHLVAQPISITRLMGNWDAVRMLSASMIYNGIWNRFKLQSEEFTYSPWHIKRSFQQHQSCRRLKKSDFQSWYDLRNAYFDELVSWKSFAWGQPWLYQPWKKGELGFSVMN